jgi:2-oxoglutarate ferredoxin oxidoreductase subunit delta
MTQKVGKYIVKLNSELCKGCGLCVEFCKSEKLVFSEKLNKMGYLYAEPFEDKKCTGCMICTSICPDLVIEVYDE